MIIDIGGGTTEIAVISMGDIVIANSIRLGGEDMTEALIEWLRSVFIDVTSGVDYTTQAYQHLMTQTEYYKHASQD
jgi:actin-like ATPase involved in cell morphogenesis